MAFVPENELEAALVAAATSPEARPRFYEVLAKSDLLIVDENPEPGAPLGRRVLEEGRSLEVRQLDIEGVRHTPVFSSPARISAVVRNQVRYLAMNARALFETVGKTPVILNPGSEYGKQFTPAEMAGVIDGSIFAPHATTVIPEDRQVLLGQPANYPTHLTDLLARYFKANKEVRAAYLAHMLDPKSGDEAHTVIGIDVDDGADFERVVGGAGMVVTDVSKEGGLVDFIRITSGGLSDYMTQETKPFYRRKVLGLF
jgi:hypothetical protein